MQNVNNLFIDNYYLLWYTLGTETKKGVNSNTSKLWGQQPRVVGQVCPFSSPDVWTVQIK